MHLFELKQYKQMVDMPQAIKALKKCSDALQFGDEPIVRGMSGEADFYLITGENGGRTSVNTNNIYTLILSEILSKQGYPKRSASIICGNYKNISHAKKYAWEGDLYMILPFNNVKIGVCPEYDMFGTKINFNNKTFEIQDLNSIFAHFLREFKLEVKKETTTYLQFIKMMQKCINDERFNALVTSEHDYKIFKDLTVDNVKSYIEQAYSTIDFKLATTKTSEVFNDGIARELWIGGSCLAIRADLYSEFIK